MKVKRASLCIIVLFVSPLLLFPAEKEKRVTVLLKVFPQAYTLFVNQSPYTPLPGPNRYRMVQLQPGNYLFTFTSDGYKKKTIFVQVDNEDILLEEKLEKRDTSLKLFAEIKTGLQPKSIIFSPDRKLIFTALLDGNGVEVFSAENYKKIKEITLPGLYANKHGFVELLLLPEHREILVSQMTTGTIHSIDMDTLEYSHSISTEGLWPKVIVADAEERYAYVSNWTSHDVSVIDIDKRKTVKKIPVSGIPRGMAFSGNQKFLYVCLYDTGNIDKIDLEKEKAVTTIQCGGGSKRHIVFDSKTNRFFISDMYWGRVYVLSGENDTILKEIQIDYNPNTITLTSKGDTLLISSRGPNHPETYLRKGPVFGKIYIMDTNDYSIEEWIWGRNQPTGLAISPDDRFLAYSNFLDATIEVYWTGFLESY